MCVWNPSSIQKGVPNNWNIATQLGIYYHKNEINYFLSPLAKCVEKIQDVYVKHRRRDLAIRSTGMGSCINVSILITQHPLCLNISLRRCHSGRDSVSNHQPQDCLLNRLFRRRSKKTSKLRVTCLCAGNSPGTGEFPVQMASNAENVSIRWRHHVVRFRHSFGMGSCVAKR